MRAFAILLVCLTPIFTSAQTKNDSTTYRNAIKYAMYPEQSKVYDQLIPITKKNPNLIWKTIDCNEYLLVVSWKWSDSLYRPYLNEDSTFNTKRWPIWVTVAPELLNRMKSLKYDDADRRLKQLLGLPPNSEYGYFIEFWVKTSDLSRPCPDNEITDTECQVCFPKDVDQAYIDEFNQMRIDRYYPCELYKQYPWTELGYTFDWNEENTSHVGLSEFVVGKNAEIKVAAIYTTESYLKLNDLKK